MQQNHIIPVSNGLFEHRERIGPAIWEFLWCIDRISSEEIDEQGKCWGLILGGIPIKHELIAKELNSSERTVRRNMDRLKEENYVVSIRTARGEIIKVRNNIKHFNDKSGRSLQSDRPNMAGHSESDRPDMAGHSESDRPNMAGHSVESDKSGHSYESDRPNVAALKDFKDLKDLNTTITTITDSASIEKMKLKKLEYEKLLVIDAFCELHKKLDFHVRVKEREIMGKMIAGGVLSPFIIRTMLKLYDDKRRREEEEGLVFSPPSTFKYYENAIYEAWRSEKTITSDVPSSLVAFGSPTQPLFRSKQQRQLDDLDKIIEEEKRREQSGSSRVT
ncbi:hypothetical protein EHS13_13615 [Paenibacillus psychroresistens]|uniref:Uncharacterized protein n=1 Tax=Paenibacillus psychroresistens TaxID=1778678 RepID=A0A6B8RH84_9BACL|nr:hypothetical protein [Paenibacillus psychroresistens]QGQ95841.1 hypothetical protein EHS13_13615 [Paenibacillus psychroresistens]